MSSEKCTTQIFRLRFNGGEVNSSFLYRSESCCEYPIVVIPVHFTNYVMLQRNLIYTAVTRAKKVCIVIGQKRALWYAVSHVAVTKRNTKLKERLQGKTVPMTYTHHDEAIQTDMVAEDHSHNK